MTTAGKNAAGGGGGGTQPRVFGWSCKKCTFFHHTKGPRCSMCGELRGATRQEMHDFVLGRPIPPVAEGNVVEIKDSPGPPVAASSSSGAVNTKSSIEGPTGNNRNGNNTTMAVISSAKRNISATNGSQENRANLPNVRKPSSSMVESATNPYLLKRTGPSTSTNTADASGRASPKNVEEDSHRSKADSTNLGNSDGSTHRSGEVGAPSPVRNPNLAAFPNLVRPLHAQKQGEEPSRRHVDAVLPSSIPPSDAPEQFVPLQISALDVAQAAKDLSSSHCTINGQNDSLSSHPFFDKTNFAKQNTAAERTNKKKNGPDLIHRFTFVPGPVPLNPNTCRTWIYPEHEAFPTRQYQLEIAETALEYNTLVSLPTGLGKTHIAAVVLYNYYRWFTPVGKVVFLAPTLPLVNQQVHACYSIMGMPANDTAVLTGKIKADARSDLWRDRRVFFCTPQTVQKDLEACTAEAEETGQASRSSFASQIVCLVLDEAHKASGDYAYTKVVELLEAAGAKFRIVGLSATPGSTIQAIQAVADALRTVRIEFRNESHPTVAPYLHQKQTEIVICPKNDGQRDVERLFTNLMGPLLERLRNDGSLRYSGNATMTSYSIHQARDVYVKSCGSRPNGGVISCFAAVSTLVQLRNECCQSLGTVKTKMLRLKNTPQRGILSTIVKSEEFDAILKKVVDVTGGDGATAATGGLLDPKLAKLGELLLHHFERAEAVDKSSRAIVFAQFRDSVSEIVDSLVRLQPMIRPRHFVGQGKGGGGNSNKSKDKGENGDRHLAGMKQAEQHRVIKAFKSNIYNVLVCTCIGEEGLDIGDVDLIVNFDVLKSPIRTIQRAGRTGRKRDGRVVCLISEGSEQQSHQKRLSNERTLHAALQNGRNFKMANHMPMLPQPAKREDRKIEIQSQLHLSQVAGARQTPAAKRGPIKGPHSTAWRLDEEEEREREQWLGGIVALDESVAWRTLRRVFLRSRVNTIRLSPGRQQRRRTQQQQRSFVGRNLQILDRIQQFGSVHTTGTTRGYQDILKVFPIEAVASKDCPPPTHPDPMRGIKKNLWTDGSAAVSNSRIEGCTTRDLTDPNNHRVDPGNDKIEDKEASRPAQEEVMAPKDSGMDESMDTTNQKDEVAAKKKARPVPDSMCATTIGDHENKPLNSTGHFPDDSKEKGFEEGCNTNCTEAHDCNIARSDDNFCDESSRIVLAVSSVQTKFENTTFRLPTPPPSSSSGSDEDDSDDDSKMTPMPQPAAFQGVTSFGVEGDDRESNTHHKLATSETTLDSILNESMLNNTDACLESSGDRSSPGIVRQADVSFRLPTQDSSSDDEENEEEEFAASIGAGLSVPDSIQMSEMNDIIALDAQSEDDVLLSSLKKSKKHPNLTDGKCQQYNASLLSPGNDQAAESDTDVPLISLKRKKNELVEYIDLKSDAGPLISLETTSAKKTKKLRQAFKKYASDVSGDDEDDKPLIALKGSKDARASGEVRSFDLSGVLDHSAGGGGDVKESTPRVLAKRTDHQTRRSSPPLPILVLETRESDNVQTDLRSQFALDDGSQDFVARQRNNAKGRNRRRIIESPDSCHASQGSSSKKIGAKDENEKGKDRTWKRPRFSSNDSHDATEAQAMTSQNIAETCNAQMQPPEKETPSRLKPIGEGLVDTPEDAASTGLLTTTPAEGKSVDFVCRVCLSGDSQKGDEIILCDSCDLGFHQRCYAMDINPDDASPWFCDLCKHPPNTCPTPSKAAVTCIYCSHSGGVQRHIQQRWFHPLCSLFSSRSSSVVSCSVCSSSNAVPCAVVGCNKASHPFCAVKDGWTIVHVQSGSNREELANHSMFCPEHAHHAVQPPGARIISASHNKRNGKVCLPRKLVKKCMDRTKIAPNPESPESDCEILESFHLADAKRERQRRRREVLAKFALEEAEIESDEDMEGDEDEEDEVRRIEEGEGPRSQDSFINDNVDLTQHFSQDDLGLVDPDAAADAEFDYHHPHRALDAQREMADQFKTPCFNRRMMRDADEGLSVPSSDRGLGQMNFIRSVLEHHRRGGDCDQIEAMYNQLAGEPSQASASAAADASYGYGTASQPQPPTAAAAAAQQHAGASSGLTAEQLAQIEANRVEALRRRAMFLAKGS